MKKKIVILFGGNSNEHLISCKSAKSILNNIDNLKYEVIPVAISKDNDWYLYEDDYSLLEDWQLQKITKLDNVISFLKSIDIVFPIIHGNTGEDGKLQGMFDLFNIKYVGCNTLTHALCLDKEYTKIITNNYNIPTVPYKTIIKKEDSYNLELDFDYPVIVKPASSGSSIGINLAENKEKLDKYINEAFKHSNKVIVEKFIKARELECAVLVTDAIYTSSVGEICYNSKFYDYDAKYVNDTRLIIPSNINNNISDKIKEYAKTICIALNIKGLSRIDFLYDEENDVIYLIEINTLPGFTEISMYPKLLNYDGITYQELISKLIDSAK